MSDTNFRRTLVTAALPYANGEIHLGHLAGAYLPADFYVRYLRLRGRPVLFICGTDEFGVPITLTAEREGMSPKELVDRNYESIKRSFEGLGIAFDNFSQTSRRIHTETAQAFFKDLHAQGRLTQKSSQQFYSPSQDRFLADRYIEGTCPKCSNPGARGDQCESCGSSLDPTDLIDPHDVLRGEPLELRDTVHWYLPLGQWQQQLEAFLERHPEWKENVKQYCRSWFKDGLGDRAVTRDIAWGVPVPLPDHEGKVLYVWFDAPIGYISATREWAEEQGDPDAWRVWWQDASTRLIHFIGKDNVVFHTLMFPAMLMAHSENFVLPDNVPANEFLNLEGQKLSTSRGFAVWLPEYLETFEPDPLRYVMARNLPETRDMNFTWEGFLARNDNELGNNFGNLINRVFTFVHKYFDGLVPEWTDEAMEPMDRKAVLDEVADAAGAVGRAHGEVRGEGRHGVRLRGRPGGQPLLRRVRAVQVPQDRPRPLRPEPGSLAAGAARAVPHAGAHLPLRHGEALALAGHGDAAVLRRLGRGAAAVAGGTPAGAAGDPVPPPGARGGPGRGGPAGEAGG